MPIKRAVEAFAASRSAPFDLVGQQFFFQKP
jgi:hypothetical protein